ncbi:rubrerythrin family protein [Patescibacteria group bacterium]|nr:rubrerythrin family protein [Patescibacteria group bacterium]
MKTLKGTQTEQNLLKAFAGESQARMRYDYFSKQAKKDGLEQISVIFNETALNEKEHAKRFFKFLDGRSVEITATYPAGKISTTIENLKAAAEGENEEWTELYPEFAKIAKEEGFGDVAKTFRAIVIVEKAHEARYIKLYNNLESGKVFKHAGKIIWKCLNCGYLYEGDSAPKECPACLHPQSYFQIKENNY